LKLIVENNDDDVQRKVINMTEMLTAKRVHLFSNDQATKMIASILKHIFKVKSRRDEES